LALLLAAGILVGCGSNKDLVVPPKWEDLGPKEAEKVAKVEFRSALALLAKHDRADDWAPKTCKETAKQFLVVAELLDRVEDGRTEHLSARYNAALAYRRCRLNDDAQKVLAKLLEDEPEFHRAAAQLALFRFEKNGDLDQAIGALEKAIADGQFKDVDALVSLATLLMRRDSKATDEHGRDDRARARLELQRALAVDDGHMAALNQLAILHLREAGGEQQALRIASVGTEVPAEGHATLELAALICSQAIRKDPGYAPIHNTAGLVQAQLGDLSGAAKAFARARELDPAFYEAHMNYAAVNLQFRGFANAQKAYEQALKVQPKSYDALLGLSLALRGQAKNGGTDALLDRAESLLAKAKKLDVRRPEAWFNEAILLQEFRAHGLAPAKARGVLTEAKGRFQKFLELAEGRPALGDARKRARERMTDIDEMLKFMP
jgi:tetratricopeptide (TPR) repeat protein